MILSVRAQCEMDLSELRPDSRMVMSCGLLQQSGPNPIAYNCDDHSHRDQRAWAWSAYSEAHFAPFHPFRGQCVKRSKIGRFGSRDFVTLLDEFGEILTPFFALFSGRLVTPPNAVVDLVKQRRRRCRL